MNYPFKSLFNSNKSHLPKTVDDGFFWQMPSGNALNWNNNNFLKDYLEVPEVNAIITQKAKAFSNGKIKVVYKATKKEVEKSNKLAKLLSNPNWMQSEKEFRMQTKIFREIFGNEFMYLYTPVGQTDNYKGLFTLPPQLVETDINGKSKPFFLETEKPENITYSINWEGSKIPLDYDNLIHLNSNNAAVKEDNYFNGKSTLSGVGASIENIRAAYEARFTLIENRGALGIFTNENKDASGAALAIKPNEKKELQNEISRYGLTRDKWQFIITSQALKYQQIGINVRELMLFEECQEDRERLCDAFGFPIELLSSNKGTTFANKNEASKLLYQNTIIPEAEEWVAALNAKFETETLPYHIVITFDHLPVMQENIKERAQTLLMLTNSLSKSLADGAITVEQYQNELKNFGI